MGRPKKDLTGQRFGYLTVLEEIGKSSNQITWNCQCDCGNIIIVKGGNLSNGRTRSCGCCKKKNTAKRNTKHNHCEKGPSPTYISWQKMLSRCYDPNNSEYHRYGNQGISVCKRWQGKYGFVNFQNDMGNRPKGKTLDRKNNNKGYYPKNCRWATPQEQAQNRKTRKRKNYYWDSRRQKWVSEIKINGKKKYLGSFNKEKDAEQTSLEAKKN